MGLKEGDERERERERHREKKDALFPLAVRCNLQNPAFPAIPCSHILHSCPFLVPFGCSSCHFLQHRLDAPSLAFSKLLIDGLCRNASR
ncbi:hypothetical protein K2173_017793 [Erythroxylum novogranatense]|uniref:Uncharacterized protein n=1 Tax=Erythroxylum novogranatense TaxID=1862640 RepID=A0AAV8T3C1_9ROSI|nr:hypothetical protein K2173_017793 [Erythroxylum novogranatense]